MADGDLTTVETALQWLGLTSDGQGDIPLQRAISAVSAAIQAFLGYSVAQTSYDRWLSGTGTRMLMLPDRPVVAVSSLSIDGIDIQASPSPLSPGFAWTDRAVVLRTYTFCRGVQNIRVVYTAGWTTTPADIEQGCLTWLSMLMDQSAREGNSSATDIGVTGNITKISAGNHTVELQTASSTWVDGLGSSVGLIPVAIAAMLSPHRRMWGS